MAESAPGGRVNGRPSDRTRRGYFFVPELWRILQKDFHSIPQNFVRRFVKSLSLKESEAWIVGRQNHKVALYPVTILPKIREAYKKNPVGLDRPGQREKIAHQRSTSISAEAAARLEAQLRAAGKLQ
ncbi:MAG: hypothetical protein RLZZ283_463 [Candidatus Parcubacteria bacterium]|jgi:hypothetical protein